MLAGTRHATAGDSWWQGGGVRVREESLLYWLTLLSVNGLGPVRAVRLRRHVPSLGVALQLEAHDWVGHGLTPVRAAELAAALRTRRMERTVERVARGNYHYALIGEPEYPQLLKNIHDPPPVLFLRGRISTLRPGVAAVGTRRATAYGRRVAVELGRDLAAVDIPVISGFARGIDRAAHEGALQTGDTVAVLGSGVDRIYPADRPDLIISMLDRGGLFVSELLPWAGPEAANFPRRNRLIAGLARAVIVVEAGSKSGALITAASALAENRAVYAVPGSVFSAVSVGCNALLQAGAQVCCRAADVVAECGRLAADMPGVEAEGPFAVSALRELATGPMTPGALQAALGCPAPDLLALLTRLELAGRVARDAVGRVFVGADSGASLHTSNSE